MIEEAHSHTKIEGNSDIHLVIEFQLKPNNEDDNNKSEDTKSTNNNDNLKSMVYGWSCVDLFEMHSFTLKYSLFLTNNNDIDVACIRYLCISHQPI